MDKIISMLNAMLLKYPTYYRLARHIGISRYTVEDVLIGKQKRIHPSTMGKICSAFEDFKSGRVQPTYLEIGKVYDLRVQVTTHERERFVGKVVGIYPRFYLVQCKNYKFCVNKADLIDRMVVVK